MPQVESKYLKVRCSSATFRSAKTSLAFNVAVGSSCLRMHRGWCGTAELICFPLYTITICCLLLPNRAELAARFSGIAVSANGGPSLSCIIGIALLFLQAAWQAGPPALQQVSRDSHIELEEESFGHDLLSTLEVALSTVETNWQGSVAALTFICLASRLLSISLHDSVRNRCLESLQLARDISIKWLRLVVKSLHDSSDESEMEYLTLRAFDLALIYHCTFDVDPRQVPQLLTSTENVAVLTECAIVVNDR
jgi:hypothetical protein